MRGGKPCRAKPCDRTQAQAHHGHPRHVRGRVPVPAGAADAARQIGGALGFNGFHRATAPGAFDQANDRQTEVVRHLLGHQRLGRDRCVRGAAAHGEIVADHDHRPAVDLATAEHAIGWRQIPELTLLIIFGGARNRPDFVETPGVDKRIDTLANGKPALVALPLDLISASHLARERFAPGEVVELRLPGHS